MASPLSNSQREKFILRNHQSIEIKNLTISNVNKMWLEFLTGAEE
jgi:hypothetical protein